MTKRYLAALSVILFSVFAFFAERFALNQRMSEFAEARLSSLKASLETLDKEVSDRNDRGMFFRYLGVTTNNNFEQLELNWRPEMIETVIVTDNAFRSLARSGRDLTLEEAGILGVKPRHSSLTSSGLLRHHDLTDFQGKNLGHLITVIKPDLSNSAATLFATTFDFKTIAAFSRDNFGAAEKSHIADILVHQTRHTREFSLRWGRYLSLRQTWLAYNMIVYQIVPLPPLHRLFSFYFVILSVLGAFVFIVHAHTAQRYTRREISERILDSHDKTLNRQYEVVDSMHRLATGRTDIQEKLIQAEARANAVEEKLERARATPTSETARPESELEIEIMPANRQFRFMNPTLTPQEANTVVQQLTEDDKKLRERAFSSELMGLMDAMGKPIAGKAIAQDDVSNAAILLAIDDFQDGYRFPEINQYLFYLNELYFDDVTDVELAQSMRVAGNAVQSGDFAIMLYDSSHAVFKTGFIHGIPPEIKDTFYLLPKDSILPNDFPDYGYVEIKAQLRKNPYFKKRFPTGFADALLGLHIFTIKENYLRARIVFFDRTRGGGLVDPDIIHTVRSYLKQLAPAMHMYFKEADSPTTNSRDLAEWAVQELKECVSLHEADAPFISQYVFETALPLSSVLQITREVTQKLGEGEKIIFLSPSHLVVVHAQTATRAIEEILSRSGGGRKFIVKESEFGVSSRNLYTFIEF
jgi:hypothetical protein